MLDRSGAAAALSTVYLDGKNLFHYYAGALPLLSRLLPVFRNGKFSPAKTATL
jgi:hypothetical protein